MIDVNTLDQYDLLLMTCTAVPNELKKEAWIKDDTLLFHDVHIKDGNSIINPTFQIKSRNSIWQYNYVYFGGTKRYYFVDDIQMDLGGAFTLKCTVDVLMSFQKAIMNCMAFESRSSSIDTGYVADDKLIFNSAPVVKTFQFREDPNEGCNFSGSSYVLGVANDGRYYNINDDSVANTYNNSQLANSVNATPLDAVLSVLLRAVREGWVYSQAQRESTGYADCSSLIDKALLYNFPNIPFGTYHIGTFPASYALCQFLLACATGCWYTDPSSPIWFSQYASNEKCPSTFDQLACGDIGFWASHDDNDAQTRWPANDAWSQNALGTPSSLKSKCGIGHVFFYVGRMVYNTNTHIYDRYKPEYFQNDSSEWKDMGNNWIIHTTGDGAQYNMWDESSLSVQKKTEPGTAFICQMSSHSRLVAAFTPNYQLFDRDWGNGEQDE